MTSSLRVRLGVPMVAVLALVLAAFSLGIHALIARALWRQFDDRLAGDAAAVAGMAEQDPGEGPELEFETLPDFDRGPTPAYYQLWLDDGRVLGRSPSLGDRDLPRAEAGRPRDLRLPDGRPGRAIQVRLPLRTENATPGDGAAATGQGVTVVVARATETVAETLAALRRWLAALGLVTLAAGSAVILAALARGLRPVREYAASLEALDDRSLQRTSGAALPAELAPISEKLSQSLARLTESFARERRFTADVAHELRTPLAALRAILDLAQTRPRDAEAYRSAIAEAAAVAREMHRLVDDLLTMARLDARQIPVRTEPVALTDVVQDCWRPLETRAGERGLRFTNDLGPELAMCTDPEKLRLIVRNLLANAADYTAAGGVIAARGRIHAGMTELEIWDSGPSIPTELLPKIFDRFVRADLSRTSGHAGIGLALVKGTCDLLELTVTAENHPGGGVSFRVAQRTAASASTSPAP
jgi:two-component system sensor histidine kinase QseC